ncbi:MAG TPA: hypothetical protein VFE01_05660, partial [Terracidiphilus sp.]|nr:hypothetical protein [Terracidiphilus sp.]
MDANLRPLTLGEILDRTVQLYRSNFLLFAGIFSFYAGVALVFNLAQIGIGQLILTRHLLHLKWLSYVTGAVEGILLLLLVGAAIAAISRAVAAVHLGEPITIRGAYASTLPRLGRYLWLSAITGFLAWWPIFVLYAGIFGTFFFYRGGLGAAANHTAGAATPAQQQATIVMGILFLVFGLLGLPALVYSIWMSLRYSLAVPACVVENLKARPAVRRAVELSKGARGRIFVLLLLIGAIKLGIGGVTQSFMFVAIFKHHGQIPIGMNVLSQLISFCTTTFLG